MPTHLRTTTALITIAVVLLLVVAPFVAPRALPQATAAQKAVRELAAVAPIEVKWNEATDIPDWLYGPLPYTLSKDEQNNPDLAARNVLTRYRDIFGIENAAAQFQLVRVDGDPLGQKHVRLQQVKDGVPVFGRILLVHLDEARALGIDGHFQPALTLATTPALTAAQAEAATVAAADGTQPTVYAPARLMIYVDDATHAATLTWQVKIETASPGETMAYFVDAQRGGLVHRLPLTATDKYREVHDAQLKDNLPGKLLSSEGTIPRDPDGAAAYKNAGIVYDYWKKTFNRDSFDDQGAPMVLVVHSPELGNSYWNGEMMVFGDSDDYITNKADALVLDIAGHEITHAVVQYTADLAYETQSGALNESFADVFAVMIDRSNWHLFEGNSASPPLPQPWLRDMQDPSLGGNYDAKNPRQSWGQPTVMKEFANLPNSRDGDWGGVHVNSGIPNHILYLAATASSREAAEQIWYRALADYLTPKSNFADFAKAIQQSAQDLYGANGTEAKAVQSALVASGIINGAAAPPPPTAAPSPGGAPVPAPVNTAGCSELVVNGAFEAARSDPWVEQTALDTPIITADFPRTGKKGVWLGGSDQESFQYVYQDIAIAANLTSIMLSYWHYTELNATVGAPDATFDALVADPSSGNVLATLEEFNSSEADARWTQSQIDLSNYPGKKIRLAFTANMARGNLSNFFVDDVSVAACAKGGQVVASGNTVTVTGTIADAATGKAIEGATFYVLTTTTANAAADGKLSNSEVLTQGASDARGNFKLNDKLPRGQSYNVVVIANGYKTIASDNAFSLSAKDPDPVDLDVKLQKR